MKDVEGKEVKEFDTVKSLLIYLKTLDQSLPVYNSFLEPLTTAEADSDGLIFEPQME